MSKRERVRSWVDGELSPEQEATLLAEAARDEELAGLVDDARTLRAHVRDLRATRPSTPPPDLVERTVQHAVRARRAEERAGGWAAVWRGLTRPHWLRLRVTPATVTGVAAAVAMLAWLAVRAYGPPPEPARTAHAPEASESASEQPAPPAHTQAPAEVPAGEDRDAAGDGQVPVRFVLPTEGARQVSVAGDFNGWNAERLTLDDPDGDGVFARTVWLEPGSYAYMFVVDGERWVTDPYASNYRDDGFGNRNAVLRLD